MSMNRAKMRRVAPIAPLIRFIGWTAAGAERKLPVGYHTSAEMDERKSYPSMRGIQLALELIGHRNPKARGARAEHFVEPRFVK